MRLDSTIRIDFINGEDDATVTLERPIVVSDWVRWHLFVMVPGSLGYEVESLRRALAWISEAAGLERETAIVLAERFGGSIQVGEAIIRASSMPGQLGVREWMDATFGAADYDPGDLSPMAPCHCFYCRGVADERDKSCVYFGMKTQAGVIADIDMELAWTMWEAPFPVYQLATMKRRSASLGKRTQEQKEDAAARRNSRNELDWKKHNLPEARQ